MSTMDDVASVYKSVTLTSAKKKSLKSVMFKDNNGFFELNQGRLEALVDWPDMKTYMEWTPGGRRFRISLVGIEASEGGKVGVSTIATRREHCRSLVKSLYHDNFHSNSVDATAIERTVNSCQTFALLVSRGKPSKRVARFGPGSSPSQLNNSIFNVVDENVEKGGSSLECIAAITLSVYNTFQFVHWLAVSKNHSAGSQFQSWRHRGIGAYLFHAVIARSVLPGVDAPTLFMLQCLNDTATSSSPSPLRFYRRLGFVTHRHADNGWSLMSGDAGFMAHHAAFGTIWVTPQETSGMCLMELPHGKLTNYATRVITVDDALPDVGSNLYAAFPIARELHELEGLTHGLRVMHQFGVPLFDNNSSIEERRAVYIVRDTGASALVAGSVMRDWRVKYDMSDSECPSMWMRSGGLALLLSWTVRNRAIYRDSVLIIPPDVTHMIGLAWKAFAAVNNATEVDDAAAYEGLVKAWHQNESNLQTYLKREVDLFQRKFIFFVNNHSNLHWSVTVAIQPGLVDTLDISSFCGYLHMDSKPGKGKCLDEPTPSFGFIFFLNYAYSILEETMDDTTVASASQSESEGAPLKQPFGSWAKKGGTAAFPQVSFAQPAIVLQRDEVNCGLAVVANVALMLDKMLNLELARNGRGVTDNGSKLVLEHFYAPVQALGNLRPDCICDMLRRDMMVFIDRLARLTHNTDAKAQGDLQEFLTMNTTSMLIFCGGPTMYADIPDAPKAPPVNANAGICAAGKNCLTPGTVTEEPYSLCVGCQAPMHVGCGYLLSNGSHHGLCLQCENKRTDFKEPKKRGQLQTSERESKKQKQQAAAANDKTADASKLTKATAAAKNKDKKQGAGKEKPMEKLPTPPDDDDDEEPEFDPNKEEEPYVLPDKPPPVLTSLTRRDFQTQQAELKTEGGLARFIDARQTLPEDQECIASERDLDKFIATSFKRIKYYTEAEFTEYETGMLEIIAQCRNDANKKRGSADANYNRKFLRDSQKQRREMIKEFTQVWMQSCEGAIRGLRYMARQNMFRARVIYYSYRKMGELIMTTDVTEEWMEVHFGSITTSYVKSCAAKEMDGFMHVLQRKSLKVGATLDMVKLRFVSSASNRSSPRKQRQKILPTRSCGYWEGIDASGVPHRLEDDGVAPEVKAFYEQRSRSVEESNDSFVILADNIPKPTITIDDSPPVVSVRFEPGYTQSVKAKTQRTADERALLYGAKLGKVLNKTRLQTSQTTFTPTQGQESAIAEFGYDMLQYEEKLVLKSWRVSLSNGDKVEVERERIVDLFGEGFAAEVELRGINGHRSKNPYIDVPVGACRIPRLEYFPFLVRPNAPAVRFPQGKHDTCIYSSFASALHFCGARSAANHIKHVAVRDSGSDPRTVFGRLAVQVTTTTVRFLQQRRIPSSFNFRNDLDESMILVGSLVASDGSVNHAVTITGGWVFDSNEDVAFPLTKEALDVCTQSEGEATLSGSRSTFSHFGHGLIYQDNTKHKHLAAMKGKPK
jgi:hypothetical protein